MQVGDHRVLPYYRDADDLSAYRKRKARERLKNPNANWTALTTCVGIRIARIA